MSTRKGGTSASSFGWLAKKHGLSEEEVVDMDARYKHADLDRSGQLDRTELKSLLHATIAVKMTPLQLDTYVGSQWHNVDRDGNGAVDFDEFLALYAILKLEAKQRSVKRPASAITPSSAAGAAGAGTAGAGAAGAAGAKPAASGTAGTGAAGKAAAKKKEKKERPKKRRKVQKTFKPSAPLTTPNYISNDIIWSVLRKNHAFVVKRDGVAFSRERGNLRNTHGLRGSGFANTKTVDLGLVESTGGLKTGDLTAGGESGLSLRLNAGNSRRQTRPAKKFFSQVLRRDNRGVAKQLRQRLAKYGRPDLTSAALARMTRLKQVSGGVTKKTQKTRARRTANK